MNNITETTPAEPTPTGKIGRLPRAVREALNRWLEDGEPGGSLLDWLNALPEVQAVMNAEFGGALINGQNLTNWRRGGHQQWRRQQERRSLVRELAEHAAELAGEAGGLVTGDHLSAVLVAELAVATQAVLASVTEPKERCAQLEGLLGTLTRVRRQDCAAARLAIEQARRARVAAIEQEEDEFKAKCKAEWEPVFRRAEMEELFNKPDFESQMRARELAEEELRSIKLEPAKAPESRPIKPNQGDWRTDAPGKAPNSKLQHPEKFQTAITKEASKAKVEDEGEKKRGVRAKQAESRLIKVNQGKVPKAPPTSKHQASAVAKAMADKPEKLQTPITKAQAWDERRVAGESTQFQPPSISEAPQAAKIDPPSLKPWRTGEEVDEEEESSQPVEVSEIELENAKWRTEHGF